MIKKRTTQGFAHYIGIMVIVVMAIVALVAYQVIQRNNTDNTDDSTFSTKSSEQAAPINNTGDLNKAEDTLNSQPVDSDLNPDQYNDDVNSLY